MKQLYENWDYWCLLLGVCMLLALSYITGYSNGRRDGEQFGKLEERARISRAARALGIDFNTTPPTKVGSKR